MCVVSDERKDEKAEILSVPMEGNDADAATVGEYLAALLSAVLREAEGFSGKRPFGNSGWEWDIYAALTKAGVIEAAFDEDGYLEDIAPDQVKKADALVSDAIRSALSSEV